MVLQEAEKQNPVLKLPSHVILFFFVVFISLFVCWVLLVVSNLFEIIVSVSISYSCRS